MSLSLSIPDFIQLLRSNNIRTFHIINSPSGPIASHALIQPFANLIASHPDYNNHEAIFIQLSSTHILQGAFVHRTCRGQAAGGVRNWHYDTILDFMIDGLRLSRGMTHKNAMAGIWWGGGKGVMARNSGVGLGHKDSQDDRRKAYEEYGQFISAIRGCYVTAEDVGTHVADMNCVYRFTRFTTCIPSIIGGSGNPSIPTAKGVLKGLQAAFKFCGKELRGSKIAIQGMGNVGMPLAHLLIEHGVSLIIASDVDEHRKKVLKNEFGNKLDLRIVQRGDNSLLFESVDAVCPCATGAILNKETIPFIKAKIICGAANNQLCEIAADDVRLTELGILYIPDFVVNRMGIVTCADEQIGYIDGDENVEKHLREEWEHSIYNATFRILKEAKESGRTTQQIAVEIAERMSMEINPIHGHRGKNIIESLVKSEEWIKRIAVGK